MPENKTIFEFLADPAFERREFLFERTGWAFMGLILLAAALGLFGNGPFSHAVLQKDQFRMEYQRYLHFGHLTQLKIEIPPHKSDAGVIAIGFPNSYLHKFRVEEIVPDPESIAHGEQTLFWFTATNTGEAVTLQFRLEPQEAGRMDGRIFVNGDEGYAFHQFVYP
jgi:hypothetical protein